MAVEMIPTDELARIHAEAEEGSDTRRLVVLVMGLYATLGAVGRAATTYLPLDFADVTDVPDVPPPTITGAGSDGAKVLQFHRAH